MRERVKPPDAIWLQYCKDGSLGQFWWATGDAEYIRRNSINYCTPEERAVIEAAVGFERAHLAAEWAFEGKPYTISDGHLRRTVKQLLATRSKEESK